MFKIKVDINNKALLSKIKQNPNHVRTGIRSAFYISGKRLKAYLQDKILNKSEKTGRVYRIRRGKRIKIHQASAPYQYPANLSGALRRSINFYVVGSRQLVFGSRADYSKYLELGTSKMAPRKLLASTIKENKEFMKSALYMEIVKELNRR